MQFIFGDIFTFHNINFRRFIIIYLKIHFFDFTVELKLKLNYNDRLLFCQPHLHMKPVP